MGRLSKTILFAGYDFEQREYRGTSFYAQSLVRAAKQLGHQNYLLTSAPDYSIEHLQELAITRHFEGSPLVKPWIYYTTILKSLIQNHPYRSIDRKWIEPHSHKLNFLQWVDGYLNKENVYKFTHLYCRFLNQVYPLFLKDTDLVFTTSPLNLRVHKEVALVQTLHDITPLVRTDHPADDPFNLFYRRVRDMLRYSDLVVSVSEFSKQQLLELFPHFSNKIITTYQPVPIDLEVAQLANEPSVQTALLRKYRLEPGNYLIFIGVLETRKNLERLIEAYLVVKDQVKCPLILVGSLGYGSQPLIPYLQNEDYYSIRHLGYIPTVDKLVLLKNATAFLFPSLYEGFGLPPIEAMQMGCPVLTSNTSALPEICRDAALYVNPQRISEIAEGILAIVKQGSVRGELIEKGYQRAEYFSHENYQHRLSKVIDQF
ncbi:MAG: glycosyltransferase family 1 protein [Leptolyngbyaceae cyanobacterium bins.59]|nr:glycosyltransferase family 1 protein [Leptolyngbyaceae cyanobacterium bins.59]